MKITIDRYQHRLLSRLLQHAIEEQAAVSVYGIAKVTQPFALDELKALLARVDPAAVPPTVVTMPKEDKRA